MILAIDRLLQDGTLQKRLQGRRIAVLGHPASVTSSLEHTLDALFRLKGLKVTCAFGPQHGMRGDKQDNMIESEDFLDPIHKIPVYSLYGQVRKPKPETLEKFDLLLIDLQDVGTRVYTFITTMVYMLEACAKAGKSVWILDRPNPAGRAIEGTALVRGQESFVGAVPIPMRHGLTMGELAQWVKAHKNLDVELEIIEMEDYDPTEPGAYGWPGGELSWVNPSPNIPRVSTVRCYPGTVLLEGTTLSEGRGTTRPLELVGAPDIDMRAVIKEMQKHPWVSGCVLRHCYFEPTFQKHHGKLCEGMQIHTDNQNVFDYEKFKPYRVIALFLKSLRQLYPKYPIWRDFEYEYEKNRMAIDVINGGPALREWVDSKASIEDFSKKLIADERAWIHARDEYLIYL